jgi:thymidylate kinase
VRQGYLNTAEKDPQRYAVIDASQSLDGVQFDIKAVLETFLATIKVVV